MIFDILGANAKNPNNKSQTLFFGIPKGTFYKKSPLAGYGAEPHVSVRNGAKRKALEAIRLIDLTQIIYCAMRVFAITNNIAYI